MTPSQLATAKVKGHLIGLVVVAIGVLLTIKTDRLVFALVAGVIYICLVAWFIIRKGLAIDQAQNERNRKLADNND